MPDCYVGIDIGTTNTKAVAILSSGDTDGTLSRRTPLPARSGVLFFDIRALEHIVDGFLSK